MRNICIMAFVTVLFLKQCVNLVAQETSPVVAGDRIRVSVSNGSNFHLIGRLVALGPDTLFLKEDDQVITLWLPLASVKKLEVTLIVNMESTITPNHTADACRFGRQDPLT